MANEEIVQEKKVMGQFFEKLAQNPGLAAYGEIDVMNKLKMGAVDILLISDSAADSVIENFEIEAQKVGTDIRLISTDTREGVQLKEIGKIAAILRYEVS